ncbi:LapA family protein [Desulfonatronum thioautotrophicum]|uniref:LapA family protein n=1 Tax=Desulfonatronum thioautotrophicum TaxID=617001 RepID=UPI0005EBA1AD|nr:LapA family protein [Desulfonatronum thioautotrophicum]
MKTIKILFFLLFCAGVAVAAVQNAEILTPHLPVRFLWPGLPVVEFTLPVFAFIAVVFLAGAILTSWSYLGEHLRLRRSLAANRQSVLALERELHPEPDVEPAPEPAPEPDTQTDPQSEPESQSGPVSEPVDGDSPKPSLAQGLHPDGVSKTYRSVATAISSQEPSSRTLQISMESSMEKKTSSPEPEDKERVEITPQELAAEEQDTVQSKTVEEPDSSESLSATQPETTSETTSEATPESAPETTSESVSASPTDVVDAEQTIAATETQTPDTATGMSSDNQDALRGDNEFERPSGPGWGAVLLLSAALALVVSSGVYIVLNNQISQLSDQLKDLHIQSGHMASTQEEMGRTWELERVAVREQFDILEQEQSQLTTGVERLEEQMVALEALPEVFRKRLLAGFLWDAAGKTAFLGTQVETDEQRDTLGRVEEMLQMLARELEEAGGGQ